MKGTFPAKLPNLKQLVIMAQGLVEIQFEDPLATASALTSSYLLGQPLSLEAVALLRLSSGLMRRGMTSDSAPGLADFSRSCIYPRDIEAEKLAIQQLSVFVAHLVCHCKCGACFTCLERAGLLDPVHTCDRMSYWII